MNRTRTLIASLSIAILAQGCFFTQPLTVEDEPQTVDATPTLQPPLSTITPAPPSPPEAAMATEPSPTPEAIPSVRVTAVNGNLYIRRGPGMAYDRLGILKKGESVDVIGRDMLSKWVQVSVPGGESAGWISLMTPYSQIDGDLAAVEAFTFTDWPQPAYIENCTEHDFYIEPGGWYLYSLWANSNYLNEIQVDPGVYQIYDLFVPGDPLIETVDIQEGETVYLTVNGLGVYHNCPENN